MKASELISWILAMDGGQPDAPDRRVSAQWLREQLAKAHEDESPIPPGEDVMVAHAQTVQPVATSEQVKTITPHDMIVRRWNLQSLGDELLVCRGEHDKSEPCKWEHWVSKVAVDKYVVGEVSAAKQEALNYTAEERENYGKWVAQQQMAEQFDFILDEFRRITVCPAADNEIVGICRRASRKIRRLVPVLSELDDVKRQLAAMTAARDRFCGAVNEIAQWIGTDKQSNAPAAVVRKVCVLLDDKRRAYRALEQNGFTLQDGVEEWKPPVNEAASERNELRYGLEAIIKEQFQHACESLSHGGLLELLSQKVRQLREANREIRLSDSTPEHLYYSCRSELNEVVQLLRSIGHPSKRTTQIISHVEKLCGYFADIPIPTTKDDGSLYAAVDALDKLLNAMGTVKVFPGTQDWHGWASLAKGFIHNALNGRTDPRVRVEVKAEEKPDTSSDDCSRTARKLAEKAYDALVEARKILHSGNEPENPWELFMSFDNAKIVLAGEFENLLRSLYPPSAPAVGDYGKIKKLEQTAYDEPLCENHAMTWFTARHFKPGDCWFCQLEALQISGFYEGDVPVYSQGPPSHELQELVTAENVNDLVSRITQLMAALSSAEGWKSKFHAEYTRRLDVQRGLAECERQYQEAQAEIIRLMCGYDNLPTVRDDLQACLVSIDEIKANTLSAVYHRKLHPIENLIKSTLKTLAKAIEVPATKPEPMGKVVGVELSTGSATFEYMKFRDPFLVTADESGITGMKLQPFPVTTLENDPLVMVGAGKYIGRQSRLMNQCLVLLRDLCKIANEGGYATSRLYRMQELIELFLRDTRDLAQPLPTETLTRGLIPSPVPQVIVDLCNLLREIQCASISPSGSQAWQRLCKKIDDTLAQPNLQPVAKL